MPSSAESTFTPPAPDLTLAAADTGPGAGGAGASAGSNGPRNKPKLWLTISAVALVVLVPLSVAIGSATVPLGVVWSALTSYDGHDQSHVIVRDMRIPRTVVAILVGVGLGGAGTLMQTVTRNPLAEPGLLGVNSGAALVVALGLYLDPSAPVSFMMVFAFTGAAVAGMVTLVLGGAFRQSVDPVRLILAGVAISVVLGALTSVIVLNNPTIFTSFRFYDAGAVVERDWSLILVGAICLLVTALLALGTSRSLDTLALGPEFARAQGASPGRTWATACVCIVIMAGTATALAGPISFIGLAAPLIARRIVGPNVRRLMPLAMLLGADLLLAADLLGRIVMRPREVQAAIVCALVGAPVFIVLARRRTVKL